MFAGQTKEAEQKRVDKELANIRQKFIGNSSLNGYQKKKLVVFFTVFDLTPGQICLEATVHSHAGL